MKRISRRSLLIAAGAGLPAAAIVALTRPWEDDDAVETPGGNSGLVMPHPPTPGPPPRDEQRIPNVRGGSVVAIDGNEITIANSKGEETQLLLSDDTVRDDGFWVGNLPIEVGDKATARGGENDAGQFAAGSLWVNLKNYIGSVMEVIDPGPELPIRFRIRDRYDLSPYHEQEPDGHVVRIDPQTLISGPMPDPLPTAPVYNLPEDVAANRHFELEVGQRVEAIGREYRGELYTIRLML